ncbi:hypothetical protein FACS189491_03340 [Spirochaetia bacterium]|nr:hypothetical protein FACS189491_03340 [Spirochaetia bacterium]
MKKRFLFVAVMAALALNVYAADSDFTVDANGVITKYSGWDTEVVIPATIGGKKITAIGDNAFKKADLTSVVIPEGIRMIGEYAFAENKLTTVTIPGSVYWIKRGAFDDNKDISTVVLPEGVEYVMGDAFPSSVKSINIPASILYFDARFGMETVVTFAANITVDMSGVFGRPGIYEEGSPNPAIFFNYIANDRKAGTYTGNMKCEGKRADGYVYYETQYGAVLPKSEWQGGTRVRIPAEIGGIPVKALLGTFDKNYGSTNQIDAVQIPESITYIGARTFWGQSLVSITIPAGVTYIGDSAFEGNGLTTVDIPAGVQYIGDQAFYRNKLTAATISEGVQYIGDMAFAAYDVQFAVETGYNKLTSITIPTGVTYIGKSAFTGLKTITIPASVTTMGGVPLSEVNPTYAGFDDNGNRIVIGANVIINDNSSFARDYNKNGKKAGQYTFSINSGAGTRTWVYSAR